MTRIERINADFNLKRHFYHRVTENTEKRFTIEALAKVDCHAGRVLSGIQIYRYLQTGFRPETCRNDRFLDFCKNLYIKMGYSVVSVTLW